jgi:uncharacterized protein
VLIDVNVLVATYREDHPNHATARKWLLEAVNNENSSADILISVGIASSFLRLVTNVKIFPKPASSEEAVDFIDWLLESKKVQFIQSTSEWETFRSLVIKGKLTVNEVPDAHLASLALSLSEPFVTFDKEFKSLLPRSLLVLLKSKS